MPLEIPINTTNPGIIVFLQLLFSSKYSEKPSAAIFISSNCWTSNARSHLAEQIGQYYPVDKLGACYSGRIPERDLSNLLDTKYRYFLAFENSNCEEYITEKVFKAFE